MFAQGVDVESIAALCTQLIILSTFIGAVIGFTIKKVLQLMKGGV